MILSPLTLICSIHFQNVAHRWHIWSMSSNEPRTVIVRCCILDRPFASKHFYLLSRFAFMAHDKLLLATVSYWHSYYEVADENRLSFMTSGFYYHRVRTAAARSELYHVLPKLEWICYAKFLSCINVVSLRYAQYLMIFIQICTYAFSMAQRIDNSNDEHS